MRYLRSAAMGLSILVALGGNVAVQETGPRITITSNAYAQAENGTVTGRVKRWTQARLEAAKKHWAEDQQRFAECTKELDDLKKKSRRWMSYDRQGHFLQDCMRAKH